jgi:hypothetical protein
MTEKWLKQSLSSGQNSLKRFEMIAEGKGDPFAKELYHKIATIDPKSFTQWAIDGYGPTQGLEGLYLRINDNMMFRGVVKITINDHDLYDIEFIAAPNQKTTEKFSDVHLEDIPRKLNQVLISPMKEAVLGEVPQTDQAVAEVPQIDPRDAAKLAELEKNTSKISSDVQKLDARMAPLMKKKADLQLRLEKLNAEKARIKSR